MSLSVRRRSKQEFISLVLGFGEGFCSARIESTVMAFKVIGSSAEDSAYAWNSLLSSFTKALPHLPNGIFRIFCFHCTVSR